MSMTKELKHWKGPRIKDGFIHWEMICSWPNNPRIMSNRKGVTVEGAMLDMDIDQVNEMIEILKEANKIAELLAEDTYSMVIDGKEYCP